MKYNIWLFRHSNRPEIKEKISKGKIGENNPNHKVWDITKPDGEKIILKGGLKRFLIDNGLTYMMVSPMLKGKKSSYKGWIIKEIVWYA